MGCGASAETRAVEAAGPAPTKEQVNCKQIEELNAACDTLADALQSNATDGVLQDYYSVQAASIGSGNFSTVRLATCKKTGQKYAVKTINLKWASRDSMKRAVRPLGGLVHPVHRAHGRGVAWPGGSDRSSAPRRGDDPAAITAGWRRRRRTGGEPPLSRLTTRASSHWRGNRPAGRWR